MTIIRIIAAITIIPLIFITIIPSINITIVDIITGTADITGVPDTGVADIVDIKEKHSQSS